MKSLVTMAAFLFLSAASANTPNADLQQVFFGLEQQLQAKIYSEAQVLGLNWKVGDQNTYSLDMGFIKGSMIMTVAEIGEEGIWLNQDMDLGFAGKQQARALIDPNTGEVKKLIVNGKEQEIPKQNVEIVETKEDKITVPAGTFECIFVRLHDKDQNKDIQTWINPREIPISGMLKTIQPGQFGNVTMLLKSFKKN
ncbi:MAG TPA: hypothetical protein PLJ21_02275 [Pseudobdellovibrionaceae bacterium]|nr:hypothetical protein [Pseudobdellovibrionaceae bacterium]